MTTDRAKAYVIARLCDAPTLEALKRVWESLSAEHQNDPEIYALKEKMKAGFMQWDTTRRRRS